MSISWAWLIPKNGQAGQHHEHQLGLIFPRDRQAGQHHEHQLGLVFVRDAQAGQHHEHQLGFDSQGWAKQASSMSISWA